MATRPRITRRYGVTAEDVATLVELLRRRAELVPVTGAMRLCRDPGDDVVIETAVNGGADALVSRDCDLRGDAELVRVLRDRGVAVLSDSQFLVALDTEA